MKRKASHWGVGLILYEDKFVKWKVKEEIWKAILLMNKVRAREWEAFGTFEDGLYI